MHAWSGLLYFTRPPCLSTAYPQVTNVPEASRCTDASSYPETCPKTPPAHSKGPQGNLNIPSCTAIPSTNLKKSVVLNADWYSLLLTINDHFVQWPWYAFLFFLICIMWRNVAHVSFPILSPQPEQLLRWEHPAYWGAPPGCAESLVHLWRKGLRCLPAPVNELMFPTVSRSFQSEYSVVSHYPLQSPDHESQGDGGPMFCKQGPHLGSRAWATLTWMSPAE